MTTNLRQMVLGLLATLVMTTGSAATAASPAQKCGQGKNNEAGKYAACRQKVEGKFALTGDAAARNAALQKCLAKFDLKWPLVEARAGGSCPSNGDQTAIRSVIDVHTTNVATALAGGALVDYPAELALCAGDLAACQACGNGVREGAEACDGSDLGAMTCVTQGFVAGTLRCDSGCVLDTSACHAVRYVDNGDGTVTDHLTGLQWEKKNGADGVPDPANPHDVDNFYLWPDAMSEWISLVNGHSTVIAPQPGLAGHSDWRMPTLDELSTIFDGSQCGSGACIDPTFGPINVTPGLQGQYWSSSTDATLVTRAIGQAFVTDNAFGTGKTTSNRWVRAVRGSTGNCYSAGVRCPWGGNGLCCSGSCVSLVCQ